MENSFDVRNQSDLVMIFIVRKTTLNFYTKKDHEGTKLLDQSRQHYE